MTAAVFVMLGMGQKTDVAVMTCRYGTTTNKSLKSQLECIIINDTMYFWKKSKSSTDEYERRLFLLSSSDKNKTSLYWYGHT